MENRWQHQLPEWWQWKLNTCHQTTDETELEYEPCQWDSPNCTLWPAMVSPWASASQKWEQLWPRQTQLPIQTNTTEIFGQNWSISGLGLRQWSSRAEKKRKIGREWQGEEGEHHFWSRESIGTLRMSDTMHSWRIRNFWIRALGEDETQKPF